MKTPLKLARNVGIAYAEDLFKDFQRPEFRGSNFKWQDFPDMMGRMAEGGVAMSIANWDKLTKSQHNSIRHTAKEAAKKRAEELLIKNPQVNI